MVSKEIASKGKVISQSVNSKTKQVITSLTKYKRLFDIAANLCDEKFKGIYFGKQIHEDDLDEVLKRSEIYKVDRLLFSAGSIEDTHISWDLSQKSKNYYITSGIHPCRATEAEEIIKRTSSDMTNFYSNISDLIDKYKSKCVAIGECGLDYDRLNYSSKEDQIKHFIPHFDLAQKHKLPMYLHARNTGGDFIKIVKENRHKFSTGVVHSFTDSLNDLKECLDLDLYIGVNGCSLKTEETMEMVKNIPLSKIMLETDAPYCDIKPTHSSFKLIDTHFDRVRKEKLKKGNICKDRNEPCLIVQVLEVVSKLLNVSPEILAEISYQNTIKMFGIIDDDDVTTNKEFKDLKLDDKNN